MNHSPDTGQYFFKPFLGSDAFFMSKVTTTVLKFGGKCHRISTQNQQNEQITIKLGIDREPQQQCNF